MVTLIILSVGIVEIFKTFFYSLDKIHEMSSRLQADILIENRISEVERLLRVYNALPRELSRSETVQTENKTINFKELMRFKDVEGLYDVFQMDLSVSWPEGKREINLSRSCYLLDISRGNRQQ